jgi:short-subunit dehydrogenase
MHDKVAFITGASRGIGAESAVALARAGYRVAITARTTTTMSAVLSHCLAALKQPPKP